MFSVVYIAENRKDRSNSSYQNFVKFSPKEAAVQLFQSGKNVVMKVPL
jgi:hypothetical protein